jgi:outer membrane receptor protein involved in Fe transport
VDVRLTHYVTYNTGNPFAFTSSPDLTRRLWNDSSSESTSGDGFATFLLRTPSSGSAVYNAAPYFRSWYLAPWVQDDWKVTKRLTLNFGLRWDLNLPPDEKHNRMNTGFDPKLPNPIQGMIPAA